MKKENLTNPGTLESEESKAFLLGQSEIEFVFLRQPSQCSAGH